MEIGIIRIFPENHDFFIFLRVPGPPRGLERFLEVVCFILAGYGPVLSHLDPIRPDFHDFRCNTAMICSISSMFLPIFDAGVASSGPGTYLK